MKGLTLTDPLLLFPLRREASFFLDEFEPQQRFPGAPCRAWFAGPSWLTVVVLQTGVGKEAMAAAMEWALGKPRVGDLTYLPKVVLCAGFAEALSPSLHVGDLVLATDVIDPEQRSWPATWPGELPPGEWRPPLTRGGVLTVSDMIFDPQLKRDLGERHNALVVDMESAVAARLCHQRGIPFGCLRVVSDELNEPLSPALANLFPKGRFSFWRLAAAVLRSPRLSAELWRLAKQTRLAGRRLATALGELLTLTLPPESEPAAPPVHRSGE